MTERENMQMVWDHKTPEWVPAINTASQMLICPEINDRPLFQSGKDWFGVEWEIGENPALMTHVAPNKQLFTDLSQWRKHTSFPSCKDLPWEAISGRTKAMWNKPDEKMGYYVGNMGAMEKLSSMMGYVESLYAIYDDREAYIDFVNAYADYRIEQMEYIKKYMNADFLMMHDDWGNQKNTFISPELWREIFKEPEKRMVDRCHELGMYYMHHSCGYVETLIEDFVEIGIDSWHAVSPVNNLEKIKSEYGDRLIFGGGVDPQVTDIPGQDEEVIRSEVRRAIDVLGKDGGYLASSAVMFSVIPGVDAIIDDEIMKYGKYNK